MAQFQLEGQTGDAGKEGVYRAASLGETGFDVLELSVGSFTFDVGGNYYFAMLPINVGGIFGLSDDAILMKLNNAGEIIGYQNVGGLVGYANNTTISSESISTANVVGVVNVGGAVGFIVNGSINGAVVGSTGTEQESNTQIVKGIYLKTLHYINIPEGSTAQSGQFNRAAIMFPTNVGGLAGSKAVESSPLTIENNTVQNVLVTSSDEGALIEYDTRDSIVKTFNTSYTISTVNNPFLYKVNENAQTTSNPQINLKNICVIPTSFSKNNEGKIKDDYLVKFDEMRTGFGGFIGSVDSRSVLDNIATNKMNGVDVHAMLGINTGAIYGSYNANYSKAYGDESQSTAHAIETPTLLSDLYVEGAYNIGGIAGNVYTQSGGVDIIAFETETSAEFVHCSANTTIHVQAHRQQSRESLVGIYVGGLFGKLEGKANDMKINGSGLKIEMTTSNSYYAGGLIGCLNGNLGEENSTINSNIVNGGNANETGKPFTINGDDKINFGGLVGMLKKTSSASEPAYVIGWQPYAFTVNTVENRNYYDGETSYDYDDQDENNLYLTAQAYYVNQDTFNISYSRGGASSVGEDVTTDNSRWFGKNSNNPLLEDTFGWAKEYTMFKIVQRNIPQSNNNGAQWDSISVVYDASKITYVATGVNATEWYGKAIDENEAKQILYSYEKAQVDTNLGLQTRAKPISLWDEYVNLYGEADALKKINEHIFFTVYEFGDNNPILYSRMGIASVMKDEKDKFITNAPASDLYVLSQNDIGGEDQPLAICGGQIYYDLAKGARKTSWTTNPDETIDISLEIDPRATNTLSYLPWYYENAVATDQNKYPSIFGWDWTWFTTSEIEVTYSYDILESLEAKNLYAKYEDEINKGSKDVYSFKTPYMIAGVNTGDQNNANIFHNWQKGSNGNEGSWSGNKKKDEALQKITYRLGERNDLSQYDITWHIAGNNNSIEMNRKANFVYKISNSVYGDVWFRFDTVFENWTTNRSDENTYTNDNLSTDGSVFNIMGLVSRDAYNKIHQKVSIPVSGDTFWEAAWRWAAGAAAAIVAALISVGVFVATGGTGAVATVAIVIGYISALTSNGLLITSLVVGLVQHFKVQNTGNVIVQMNTLENRQDLSFGLFADSYTREVKYVKNENGDWVMKVQIDSSVTYKDEHIPNQETGELPYMFYSSTRPTDYYKGYYLVAVNGAAGKSSAESLSDLFEKVPKKDVTINTDGKYEYCGNDEKFKGKDKDLTIVKTYVYENGMYYISAFASTNIYTPSQDFAYNIFNGENCKYNASQFVSDSGIYYVQGQYDSSSGKYTLPNKDLTGNLLVWDRENSNIRNEKDSGSGVGFADFESNVGVPFVTESNITFVPATDEYNTDNENNGYIYRVKDTVRNRLYLGYGYMKGVYYTANGKNVNIGSKVASFSKFSDSDSIEGLTEGVDYIVVTYNDTSHQITDQDGKVTGYQPATAYYKFSSMGTASDAKNYSNGTVQIGEYSPNGLPDNINVNLYPSAFENPYHVNNTGFTYDGNQYFINTNCLEEKNPTGISHKVQYFYYDGGYKVGSYKNQDQLDNGSGIVFTSTAVVSNYDLGLDSDNLGSITIDLYDQSGAQIFAPDNQPITLYYLAANFNSYKNYYLTNSTEAMYKVVNNYKIEGGEEIAIVRTLNGRIKEYTSKVYEIYTLNMEYVVKDGVLMNVDVQFPTANDEDFNRNKYLMNSSLQIYTRYKFTDGKIPWTTANNSNNGNQFTDFDTEHALGWVKEQATGYKYYLFKNNANPNSGSRNTTYLTENVLVTLGGGKNVKTSSLGSANTKSGSFNAK